MMSCPAVFLPCYSLHSSQLNLSRLSNVLSEVKVSSPLPNWSPSSELQDQQQYFKGGLNPPRNWVCSLTHWSSQTASLQCRLILNTQSITRKPPDFVCNLIKREIFPVLHLDNALRKTGRRRWEIGLSNSLNEVLGLAENINADPALS